MRKAYKSSVFLDTCIVKNLLGFDESADVFQSKYNKNLLERYIKHHGCILSVFTLFEILKDKKIDNEQIQQNFKNLNFIIYTPYDEKDDILSCDYKSEIFNKQKRECFIQFINKKIIDFASIYYTDILIYPYILNLCNITEVEQREGLKLDFSIINKKTLEIIEYIEKQINFMFSKAEIFKKTSANKILNSFYKWITHITVDWFNNEISNLAKTRTVDGVYEVCNAYLERLKKVDFSIDLVIGKNNEVFANADSNFIYIVKENTYKLCNNKLSEHDWNIKFVKENKKIVNKIYKKHISSDVIDVYFNLNLDEFYFQHIIDYKGVENPQKSFRNMIDTNDIVDLLSLNLAEIKNDVYLTLDNKLKRVINKLYNKQKLEVFNIFIKEKLNEI